MIKNNIWTFPVDIAFETVSLYLKEFEELQGGQTIHFDLTNTRNIHSSFIGFLIDTKQKAEKSGGNLDLHISPEIEKIFVTKGLTKFLQYNPVKKSA